MDRAYILLIVAVTASLCCLLLSGLANFNNIFQYRHGYEREDIGLWTWCHFAGDLEICQSVTDFHDFRPNSDGAVDSFELRIIITRSLLIMAVVSSLALVIMLILHFIRVVDAVTTKTIFIINVVLAVVTSFLLLAVCVFLTLIFEPALSDQRSGLSSTWDAIQFITQTVVAITDLLIRTQNIRYNKNELGYQKPSRDFLWGFYLVWTAWILSLLACIVIGLTGKISGILLKGPKRKDDLLEPPEDEKQKIPDAYVDQFPEETDDYYEYAPQSMGYGVRLSDSSKEDPTSGASKVRSSESSKRASGSGNRKSSESSNKKDQQGVKVVNLITDGNGEEDDDDDEDDFDSEGSITESRSRDPTFMSAMPAVSNNATTSYYTTKDEAADEGKKSSYGTFEDKTLQLSSSGTSDAESTLTASKGPQNALDKKRELGKENAEKGIKVQKEVKE